jgi:hypothetical protein
MCAWGMRKSRDLHKRIKTICEYAWKIDFEFV